MATILRSPEGSVTLGVAVAALVYGVYTFSTPPTAVIHATKANDANIDAGRRKAAWTSAAVVGAIALLTKDKTIFVLGGTMLIMLDWHTRHANVVDPTTGSVVSNAGYEPADSAQADASAVQPPIAGQAAY
jgi:hypothetical protein